MIFDCVICMNYLFHDQHKNFLVVITCKNEFYVISICINEYLLEL